MKIEKIIKRDGRYVDFDIDKISNAIFKAAKEIGGSDKERSDFLAKQVESILEENGNETPSVEEIQDVVEKILIENGHAKVAKQYILYRAERTRVRNMNTKLMKIYEDLTFKDAAENDIKRENANIDGDTAMGTMLKYGSEGAKQFYEMFVLDPEHSKAHIDGDIHIHDLDFYALTTTCTQIDLRKLLKGGFNTGHGFLREPNDIASYSALAAIAIQSNQNDQHGGQSVPYFDYSLAEGVKKTYRKLYLANLAKVIDFTRNTQMFRNAAYLDVMDHHQSFSASREVIKDFGDHLLEEKNLYPTISYNEDYAEEEYNFLRFLGYHESDIMLICSMTEEYTYEETKRAVYQAMEAFVHNLNTMHSRAGAQVPFSSINYGTDTSPEGRMIIESVLLATEAGLGNGETPIFPIHIFKVKEGVNYNPGDPNYDLFKLACRVSAKRLFPNFSFIDAPFNLQYYKKGDPDTEVAYMGCRTRVMANVHDLSKELTGSRGNLSFTSINLPRLAIEAKGNIDKFFKELDKKVNLCTNQLYARFLIQGSRKVKNYPFLMGQGVWLDSDKLKPDDEVREILKHGTLSVGFIGLAEALKALIGVHHGESKEAQELGLKIIGHMRKKLDYLSSVARLNYTLLATPAEGLSGRFVKIDREKYGTIEGVTDREYYTNSFHIPVYHNINAFDKIKLEAPYHALTNAGHISYVELDGDPTKNLEAFEQVIRCMKESGIGYGSINHPVDRDPICGYTGIIDNECPQCHRKENEGDVGFERIRRITGYLVGTLDRFNNAKSAEVKDRVKHGLNSEMEQL